MTEENIDGLRLILCRRRRTGPRPADSVIASENMVAVAVATTVQYKMLCYYDGSILNS